MGEGNYREEGEMRGRKEEEEGSMREKEEQEGYMRRRKKGKDGDMGGKEGEKMWGGGSNLTLPPLVLRRNLLVR